MFWFGIGFLMRICVVGPHQTCDTIIIYLHMNRKRALILAGGRRSKTKPKQINLKRSRNNLDNRLILYYTNLATDRQTNGLIHTRFSSFVCPRIDRF